MIGRSQIFVTMLPNIAVARAYLLGQHLTLPGDRNIGPHSYSLSNVLTSNLSPEARKTLDNTVLIPDIAGNLKLL